MEVKVTIEEVLSRTITYTRRTDERTFKTNRVV